MGNEEDPIDQKRPAEVAGDQLIAKMDEREARMVETMTELVKEMRLLNRIILVNLVLTTILAVKLWWP